MPDGSSIPDHPHATNTLARRPRCPCGLQPMQLLSLYPRAYLLPRFVDPARCQHVIDMATRRLAPSGL